jgi:hypothetical protein
VFAILTCAYTKKDAGLFIRPIYTCADSQAALKALTSPWCKTKLLSECRKALGTIGRHCKVEVLWVPGHMGVSGNELAGELAKAGANTSPIGPEPFVPITPSTAIVEIKTWGYAQHSKIW